MLRLRKHEYFIKLMSLKLFFSFQKVAEEAKYKNHMKTLGCLLKYRSMRVFYDQCTSRYRTTIPPSVFLHQNITIPQIGKPFSISRFRGYFDVGKHGIHRLNDCSEIRFQCILLYVSFYFNYGFPLEYNS